MNHLRQAALIFTIIALTILPADAVQRTTSKSRHITASSQMHPRSHRRAAAAPQRQIACTVLGCHPVPPGCHPEPQRYFSGMTTGFDTVVCR
jgi:hypothetical protein